jgi:hypothetical protein
MQWCHHSLVDAVKKTTPHFNWKYRRLYRKTFTGKLELKFKEEINKVLKLKHNFVWC